MALAHVCQNLLLLLHFALEETIGTTQNDWFCASVMWLRQAPGVDSSYNVQANMSVRRGITRGISVHSIYKEKVLFFYSVYIYKGYYEL